MKIDRFIYMLLVGVVFMSSGVAQKANAQQSSVSLAAIAAACGQGPCVRVVEQTLANLSKNSSSADQNTEIGLIASSLLGLSKKVSPQKAKDIAAALNVLSAASTDTAQQKSLQRVALDVGSGRAVSVGTDNPVAASGG